MNPLAKPRYQLETESLPSTAAVGVAAGRVSQVSAKEEREPWIPVLKDGAGGAGRGQVPESFPLVLTMAAAERIAGGAGIPTGTFRERPRD